jgi:hypothetical protein
MCGAKLQNVRKSTELNALQRCRDLFFVLQWTMVTVLNFLLYKTAEQNGAVYLGERRFVKCCVLKEAE